MGGGAGATALLASGLQTLDNADLVSVRRGLGVDIGERRQANILVLAPVGRIDNLTSTEFQARLLAPVSSTSTDVVVAFSGVEYVSSAGLRALMAAPRLKPTHPPLPAPRPHTLL